MSDPIGKMTKTEISRLIGGWRRHLYPWGSPKKQIEAATKNDPLLRRKALWSLQSHHIDTTPIIICAGIPVLTILSLTVGNNPIIHLFTVSLLTLTLLSIIAFKLKSCEESARSAIYPLFEKLSRSTGYPELDAIFTLAPFEAEDILTEGGMRLSEIKEVSAFGRAMTQEKQREHQIAEGLITVNTTLHPSSRAWELLRRATDIMSGKVVPESLLYEPPVTNVLDVMEYAGIPVRS